MSPTFRALQDAETPTRVPPLVVGAPALPDARRATLALAVVALVLAVVAVVLLLVR